MKTLERQNLVRQFLREKGFLPDRWGNWHHPDRPDRRYKLGKRNLKHQSAYESASHGRRWSNLRSTPYGKIKLIIAAEKSAK